MKKKIVLVIQGEGRGHLTQALVVKKRLEENGNIIPCVLVGSSSQRKLPDYFYRQINTPVHLFQSPNFVTDNEFKKIKLFKSIVCNLKKLKTFIRSIRFIKKHIDEEHPDLIINFYEPLVGLYNLFYKKTLTVSIAHQYIYLNKHFKFPVSGYTEKKSLILFTRLTAIGSDQLFALSPYPLEDTGNRVKVIPPLIRNEIKKLPSATGDFFLVYLLNKGLSQEIIEWHKKTPGVKMQCFWDKTDIEEEYYVNDHLVFHKLNDKKFIELMAGCKGLITTAGFESICEAAYLEKPIMMVPVEGHFEQYCNAQDFEQAGLANYSKTFNPNFFIDSLPFNPEKNRDYKTWCNSRQDILDSFCLLFLQFFCIFQTFI